MGLFNDREGPELVPEHVVRRPAYHTCDGCRYFENVTTQPCGGFGGTRKGYTMCSHADVSVSFGRARSRPEGGQGELLLDGLARTIRLWSGGLWSGGEGRDVTPSWCPYLKKTEEEKR